jgi:signal transduction histidine kinase
MSSHTKKASPPAAGTHRFFKEIQTEFLVHELKDPLSVIETGVRLLLERQDRFGALSEKQHKTLQRVLRNAEKARSMMYDMLEIGRSESGCFVCSHFDPVKTALDVLREALELFPVRGAPALPEDGSFEDMTSALASRGIHFTARLTAPNIEMMQDETKFRQITGNLIKNALAHRSENVEVTVANAEETLLLEVTDDGPGIDPAHHALVFERYAQVDACSYLPRSGHGIGLAGALILARSLGGDVSLHSRKGAGATFRLVMPLALEIP